MKEKIKEKLPGGHKDEQQQTAMAGEYAGTHGAEATGEKKGVMDKIKEKLPAGGGAAFWHPGSTAPGICTTKLGLEICAAVILVTDTSDRKTGIHRRVHADLMRLAHTWKLAREIIC